MPYASKKLDGTIRMYSYQERLVTWKIHDKVENYDKIFLIKA
jgi:hypothetical protein